MLLYFMIERNRRNLTRLNEKESRSAPNEAGRLDVVLLDGSERKFTSQLPESGLVGRRRLAEISVRKIRINVSVVCPVEDIEHFKPELEIDAFRNMRVFVEVDIGFVEVRPAECVGLLIPLQTKSWNGKVALGNSSREPSAVRVRLAITGRIRLCEIVPIAVVVAAASLVSDSRVGGRAPGDVAKIARLAHRQKAVAIPCSQGITRLEDARAAGSPAPGQVAQSPPPSIQALQLVVETEGEAIGHIEDRWPVILLRIQPSGIGIVQRVILGTGTSVGRIQITAREVPPYVKDHSVVVAMAVIVGVGDRAETGVEPCRAGNARSQTHVHLLDQVAGEGINVHPIRDIADGVAVTDDIVGVRPVVADAGRKVIGDLAFHGYGPDVGFRGLQQRVNTTNTKSCSDHATLGIKPAS